MEIIVPLIVIGCLLFSISLFGLGFATHKWWVEEGPASKDWND